MVGFCRSTYQRMELRSFLTLYGIRQKTNERDWRCIDDSDFFANLVDMGARFSNCQNYYWTEKNGIVEEEGWQKVMVSERL